jgi:hypothetical protein
MPDIMPSIILGIPASGNAGFAQPDARTGRLVAVAGEGEGQAEADHRQAAEPADERQPLR